MRRSRRSRTSKAAIAVLTIVGVCAVGMTEPRTAAAVDLPTLNVGDISLTEGDGGYALVGVPVALSSPSATTITVKFTLVAGTASSGSDFAAKTGTIRFSAGVTSRKASVKVFGDTTLENDEQLSVHLHTPFGATIADADGTVDINDDDANGTGGVEVAIGDVTVLENDAGTFKVNVPLTLSVPAPSKITVTAVIECSTAAPGIDFLAKSTRTVSFAAGTRAKSLLFEIVADSSAEAVQSITSSISVASGPAIIGEVAGEVMIVDDDGAGGGGPGPIGSSVIERVSVAIGGDGDGAIDPCGVPFGSNAVDMSADGRFVLFWSLIDNLVADDTNQAGDLFVRDRVLDVTERVDLLDSEAQLALGVNSSSGSLSDDGRYVVFSSASPEFGLDEDGWFLRDRTAATTVLASVLPDGTPADGASIAASSNDGAKVAFIDDANLYVRSMTSNTTAFVASASNWTIPAFSADGTALLFESPDASLVTNDTNELPDVFVRDLLSGSTERVNVTSAGIEESGLPWENLNPSEAVMSGDGRYVAFTSLSPIFATDHASIMLRDRVLGTTEVVSLDIDVPEDLPLCFATDATVSDDGRYVGFEYHCEHINGNSSSDDLRGAFVRDRLTAETIRLDEDDFGVESNANPVASITGISIAEDGSAISFGSYGSNLVADDDNNVSDVFVRSLA
jgi:hypothetical protein